MSLGPFAVVVDDEYLETEVLVLSVDVDRQDGHGRRVKRFTDPFVGWSGPQCWICSNSDRIRSFR